MDFGIILSQLRISKHLSQKELAEKINTSVGTIGMWETHRRLPSLHMLIKIAQYFNVSTDYLLGITDNPHHEEDKFGFQLTDDETYLLETYHELNQDDKRIVLGKALDLKRTAHLPGNKKKDIG